MTAAAPIRPTTSRREALWQDPLLAGDMLLVALAWDHLLGAKAKSINGEDIERLTGMDVWKYRTLVLRDIPSYVPPKRPWNCSYVGPRGGYCPRRWASSARMADPDDGTVTWLVACTLHRSWAVHRFDQYRADLAERVPPKPAYNTRSRVAHHFDEVDFPAWWATWTSNDDDPYDINRDPERGGAHVMQRPQLKVVLSL